MTSPSPDPVPARGCPVRSGGTPLYGPEFARDPAGVYAQLRDQHGLIAPVELAPGVPAHLVLGYEAALEVLREPAIFPRDPRTWEAGLAPDCPVLPMMGWRPNCLFTDGAVHSRLRSAVTDSLDRVDPHLLRRHVEATARTLLSRIAPGGVADLLTGYATPLALGVFSHLYGCPPELGDRLLAAMAAIFDMVEAEKANAVLGQCMGELIALKRRSPGTDVPSAMMAHPARLTDEELLHQLILMMGAGTEPQANLISNGALLLLSNDRFAGDLAGGSVAVEEALEAILWTDPPIANYSASYPRADLDVLGTHLRAHQPVVISFAAANLDPALHPGHRVGNRAHLAWGAGVHSCPAQQPARVIASAAIETLLDVLPDVRLAIPAEHLVWRQGPFHRALTALPVTFSPATVTTDRPVSDADQAGEHPWTPMPTRLSSTRPAVTSTAKTPGSATAGPRRWWNSLAAWWRGQ